MALEIETREIDGHRYTYRPLGSKAGMRLFVELTQRLGDSIGSVVGSAQGEGSKLETGAKVVGSLVAKLDPDFVDRLIETFAAQTRVAMQTEGGQEKAVELKGMIELHFQRRIMAQFQWLAWCLEAQYEDFFGWLLQAIGGDVGALQAKLKGG